MTIERFMAAYEPALRAAHAADPERYAYPADEIPGVLKNIGEAILANRFNHQGPAFRAACKALGIKHTQTAIREYVGVTSPAKPAPVVPLVQARTASAGIAILRVAQDATADELRQLHLEHGITGEDYDARPVADSVALDRWRRKYGLALVPGERRTP